MRSDYCGPLPLEKTSVVVASPEERGCLDIIQSQYTMLKSLGWNDVIYAPKGKDLLLIEVGSTGIFKGYRDEAGSFWVYDGDEWPSKPCLFKLNIRNPNAQERNDE